MHCVTCPFCGNELRSTRRLSGISVRCNQCSHLFVAPRVLQIRRHPDRKSNSKKNSSRTGHYSAKDFLGFAEALVPPDQTSIRHSLQAVVENGMKPKRLRLPTSVKRAMRDAAISYLFENLWSFSDLDEELTDLRALNDRRLVLLINAQFEGGWAAFERHFS